MTSLIDPAIPLPNASVAALGFRQNFRHMRDEISPLQSVVWRTGVVDFTTAEQDTGLTWIDGKPVYQRTIFDQNPTGNHPARNPGTTVTLATGMSVIEDLIEWVIVPMYTGAPRYAVTNFDIKTIVPFRRSPFWIEGDELKLRNDTVEAYTYNDHFITLRYTKV